MQLNWRMLYEYSAQRDTKEFAKWTRVNGETFKIVAAIIKINYELLTRKTIIYQRWIIRIRITINNNDAIIIDERGFIFLQCFAARLYLALIFDWQYLNVSFLIFNNSNLFSNCNTLLLQAHPSIIYLIYFNILQIKSFNLSV